MIGSARIAARLVLRSSVRLSSTAAATAVSAEPSSSQADVRFPPKKFAFFPRPKEVVPVMEISRKLGGSIAETVYQVAFEKQYSREGIVRGANQGICSIAESIADRNWHRLASIATTDLTEQTEELRKRFTDSSLNFLKFSQNDIVCSFLHSSVIAGKQFFKLSASGNVGIYFTVVSFIRLSGKVPERISLKEATGKYRNDVLVANVTFARTLNPLGSWKATAFNFFTNEN